MKLTKRNHVSLNENERKKTEDRMQEQALIKRLREGDPGAVDDLVDEYKKPVFAFILRLVNDHYLAEDLFQETWIKVIRYIKSFRGDSKLSTWLFQIALNQCRDTMRKKKYIHVPLEEAENIAGSTTPDAEHIFVADEVRKIVAELPLKMKEVVVLKYFHDLHDKEISQITGIPSGTVNSRLHRASDIMRKKWTLRNK